MKTPRMVLFLVVISLFSGSRVWSQDDLDAQLEQELDSEVGSGAAPEPAQGMDELDQAETPPPAELPPEEGVAEIPPPQEEALPQTQEPPIEEQAATPPAETPSGPPVKVTGLDFRANENGGTVVIKTSAPTTYTTRTNPGANQFIIEVQNAILPKKFQRPYNTKEFSGAFGLVTGYQNKGSTTARIVVQMKEAIEPQIQQEGGTIMVMAVGANQTVAEAPTPETPVEEPAPTEAPPAEEPPVEAAVVSESDEKALQGRTLDDFLSGNMKFFGRPISIQVKDGDLRDVFNFISEESGLNLVLTDEVSGKISLKLKEIPWDQALVVVMQSKQLGYIRQGNILRIAPLKTIRAETDATKEVIESQKQLQALKIKIFPVSYAQAKDLEPQIQGFLSTRGKVRADTRTNALVVNDIPEVISKVGKLLHSLDSQTPQVLIEGKVVEARDAFSRSLGIRWAWSPKRPQTGTLGTENYATLSAGASNSTGTGGPFVGRLFDWDTVAAAISLGETEEKVKVLSSPRIVTLNNEKAVIEQTEEVPLFTTTISNGQNVTSVSYKTAKLQLDVTPQITAEGGVVLNLSVSREFFGSEVTLGAGTTARPLNTRNAKTKVLVDNGETAVIAGIYQADNTDGGSGVPFLRSIPLIGKLFGNESVEKRKNELLIFLSPRVLNKEKAFGGVNAPSEDAIPTEPPPSEEI